MRIPIEQKKENANNVEGTISQCVKYLYVVAEYSLTLAAVLPPKKDAILLMPNIIEVMGIGKPYKAKYKGTYITRIRKCSSDLVLRYFVKRANGMIEDVLPAIKTEINQNTSSNK